MGFFNNNNFLKILAVVDPFIMLLIFNGIINKGYIKTELDDGTKELLNAAKEKGRNNPNYKEINIQTDDNKKEKKE